MGQLCTRLTHHWSEVEFVDTQDVSQVSRALEQSPANAVLLNVANHEDAWPVVEAIRREAPRTPILGCSVPRRAEQASAAGAVGHLIKPVTRTDLERAFRQIGKPIRRVLVVDDDPEAIDLFGRMLKLNDSALEIMTASSGQEALEALHRDTPDLVLLDIVMPDMDGWQVLESMKQEEKTRRVPTFFLSAQDLTDEPDASPFLLTTIDEGISLGKLIRCSLALSELLLQPEGAPDPAPL
jgi:CheY-like chemotaxis protein